MSQAPKKPRSTASSCLIAGGVTVVAFILLAVGGFVLVKKKFSDFDTYRDRMAIRPGLAVTNENLRYSPGMDAMMWCRFTATASSINDVFDPSRVDTSEFSRADYDFHSSTMNASWWDVTRHRLTGGEVQLGGDFMRVAYRDNGDGTLTVYILWFEV